MPAYERDDCRSFKGLSQAGNRPALLDRRLLGAGSAIRRLGDVARAPHAAFGLELNRAERWLFASVAGSRKPPAERVRELWCAVSRRSGKSLVAAALAERVIERASAHARALAWGADKHHSLRCNRCPSSSHMPASRRAVMVRCLLCRKDRMLPG